MDRDTCLLRQVHPAKLGADIGTDVVSTWLMWRRRPRTAVLLAHTADLEAANSALDWVEVLKRHACSGELLDLEPLAAYRSGHSGM
jgi:hypothetical protein